MNMNGMIEENGVKKWFKNGKLHRDDGPAMIDAYDVKKWYINGELHREDGPAVVFPDGSKYWFINDKLHRLDGPAIVLDSEYGEWWINDKEISKQEVKKIKKWIKENNIDPSTQEGKLALKMKWA